MAALRSRSQAAGGSREPLPRTPAGIAAEVAEDSDRKYAELARLEEEARVARLKTNREDGEAQEQRAGEEALAAAAGDEGQRVEVSWGDELFQPLRFNGMRVGPFTATTLVRRGESIAQATVRLHREVATAAQKIFEEKSRAYLQNLAGLAASAGKVEIPG